MKYNELSTTKQKLPKRAGRGIAAGRGKTAGRGTKGQNSRTGSTRRLGFEGGQNPLMQRLPKLRGFRSFKTKTEIIYTGQLETISGRTVDNTALAEAGLISSAHAPVKLLVKGELTKAKTIRLQGASAQAVAAVEKAGGAFEPVARIPRPASEKKQAKKAAKK